MDSFIVAKRNLIMNHATDIWKKINSLESCLTRKS